MAEPGFSTGLNGAWTPSVSIEEARERARERFKSRLEAGAKIGNCGCGDDDAVLGGDDGAPSECVVGVRFRDSGSVYYFRPGEQELTVGDWVVVPTSRGDEAARVVIDPHQVRASLLQGELAQVRRRLDEDDISRMESYRRGGAEAVRAFGARVRSRGIGIKPIAAEFAFDGASALLSYSVHDRERAPESDELRALAHDLAMELRCRIELRQVGPRDEARLLGGLGRCGRTLCCSSWLPVFPEISMSMAKTQDLPLNPSKVSGVCGRLLCCLSYENDQYRQMKSVMPKLGQTIETPGGPGTVMSMQLLKELVTVRLEEDNAEITFRCDELGLTTAHRRPAPPTTAPSAPQEAEAETHAGQTGDVQHQGEPADGTPSRRRRRRGRRRGGASS